MAKRITKRTRQPTLTAEEKRLAREYAEAVKNLETAHADEIKKLEERCAETVARHQQLNVNLLAEKAAAERKVTVVEKERDAALHKIKTLTEEGNQLRGMIRNNENELARSSGYMQAIEDAKPKPPARMIPAPEPEPERYEPEDDGRPGAGGYLIFKDEGDRYSPKVIRKGWWER